MLSIAYNNYLKCGLIATKISPLSVSFFIVCTGSLIWEILLTLSVKVFGMIWFVTVKFKKKKSVVLPVITTDTDMLCSRCFHPSKT